MSLSALLSASRVVPVMVVHEVAHAVPLARALLAGGLSVLEVTLRTDAAFSAIERIAAEVPDAVVGAGTVLNARDLLRAKRAGARFIVSPGLTDVIVHVSHNEDVMLLPGVATASEVMRGLDHGLDLFKFFPRGDIRRRARVEGVCGTIPEGSLLSDRWHHAGERTGIFCTTQCPGSWRLMDDSTGLRAESRCGLAVSAGPRCSGARLGFRPHFKLEVH